jgi:hypothetical protein
VSDCCERASVAASERRAITTLLSILPAYDFEIWRPSTAALGGPESASLRTRTFGRAFFLGGRPFLGGVSGQKDLIWRVGSTLPFLALVVTDGLGG